MNNFEVITFDCYGTLIDWETGMRNAFRAAMSKTGAKPGLEAEAVKLYEEEERRVEREKPHLPYRGVLSKTSLAVARKIGWKLSEADSSFLAKDLPRWIPFADTNSTLEKLARRYTLGILSNVDNDLIEGTLNHFPVRFNMIVTAENVKSYKPGLAHFEEARRIIGNDRPWLHVAASQYHDIEPASRLGISAVWVNRKNVSLERGPLKESTREVRDLRELVGWLEANGIKRGESSDRPGYATRA